MEERFHCRRLAGKDLRILNDLQRYRGFAPISGDQIPPEWIVYGAFTQEEEIAAVSCLFLYRRIPHEDYPSGRIAEIGGCYTLPDYRKKGIMTELVRLCLEYPQKHQIPLDAVVADASEQIVRLFMEEFGFEHAVDGETRVWWTPSRQEHDRGI